MLQSSAATKEGSRRFRGHIPHPQTFSARTRCFAFQMTAEQFALVHHQCCWFPFDAGAKNVFHHITSRSKKKCLSSHFFCWVQWIDVTFPRYFSSSVYFSLNFMAAICSTEAGCYSSVQVLRPVIFSSSRTWLRTGTFLLCSSYINLLLMNVRALPFAIAALTGLIEPLLNYLPREEAENLWRGFTALPINQVQNSLFCFLFFS